MAYLPEEKSWEPGVFQIETNTPWVGGLEGNSNKQARAFIKRLNYLKDYADELAAARGSKANLGARLDQYDALDPESVAALYMFAAVGIDMAGLANRETSKTIHQRIQSGTAFIINRGVISGCVVSKSTGAVRNLTLAAGKFFMNGQEYFCPGAVNAALVPANSGNASQTCYAYIFPDNAHNARFATTGFGESVPENALALYRITVPAGNTGANDPNLENVTLTDVRRLEAGYPLQFNTLAYASVALPYTMLDSEYEVVTELLELRGGSHQRSTVYPGDKAANGFKIYTEGTLDMVRVRWTAIKTNPWEGLRMIIEKVDPERECFNDFSLDGDRLTIGGVTIDLAAEQGDQETIITLGCCEGMVHRGLMPCRVYVAEVLIPPRRYGDEEVTGEEGETQSVAAPLPLDTESVVLRLWPVVDGAASNREHRLMEENNGSE